MLGGLTDSDGNASPVCPRQLLKRVSSSAKAEGFSPVVEQEFEWFNFRETTESAEAKQYRDLTPITPGMFGYSLLRAGLPNHSFRVRLDEFTPFGHPTPGLHAQTRPVHYDAAVYDSCNDDRTLRR